jgi:hypothetical protein
MEAVPSDTALAVVSLLEKNWTLTVTGTVPAWVLNKVEFTCTAGTLAIATAANEAMFFHNTTDLSYLAAEPDGTSNYLLEFVDDAGKKATAYAASVGGGESLGSELLVDPSFDDPTKWTFTGSGSISGGKVVFNNIPEASVCSQTIPGITVNSLYRVSVSVDSIISGSVNAFNNNSSTSSNVLFSPGIVTSVRANFSSAGTACGLRAREVGTIATATDISVKKLTDIPATGLRLVTTQNGSTRGMALTETGFNPNTVVKIRFLNPNL